jgi:MFS transporter, DHA1 family, tetracycline resistance protein
VSAAKDHGDGRRASWPVNAAGFTTAFGAHSVAAGLGGTTGDAPAALLTLGLLLAVYDGAEIVLKPVFGAVVDRVGPRRVLLGGLAAFAVASSTVFVIGHGTLAIGVARLGQGAAAAAFSPAASTLVARLATSPDRTGPTTLGRRFGRYGAWKGLGYALGPVLGAGLITVGGFPALFAALAVLAAAVAAWSAVAVPAVAPLPRARQTVLDLARFLTSGWFLRPTAVLAAATAGFATAVGFLPARGAAAGLPLLVTGTAVTVLAVVSAFVQPATGRALDAGRLSDRAGILAGLVVTAAGLAAGALLPPVAAILVGAVLIGAGAGVLTPLAFAALAAVAPPQRLGQTMGSAEVGRELGDAGGPLLVGSVASAAGLAAGLTALAAAVLVLAGLLAGRPRRVTG